MLFFSTRRVDDGAWAARLLRLPACLSPFTSHLSTSMTLVMFRTHATHLSFFSIRFSTHVSFDSFDSLITLLPDDQHIFPITQLVPISTCTSFCLKVFKAVHEAANNFPFLLKNCSDYRPLGSLQQRALIRCSPSVAP